ncbi:MAG: fasciclin domain-containing protein [Bifidobacteriaceae bacterium]|nr:fasciclin domain-containing protein [Bifidobacteriaceae bacterium]
MVGSGQKSYSTFSTLVSAAALAPRASSSAISSSTVFWPSRKAFQRTSSSE